jgi:hypothetical protein
MAAGCQRPTAEHAYALARLIDHAANRLPGSTNCLPRAMTLSWALRRCHIAHDVVFAVRPEELRHSEDALHAWVERDGERLIGDLPGEWHETLRLSGSSGPTSALRKEN